MSNLPTSLTFVDVETTGCRISDRIIEVGVLKVENNKVIETFQTLLNPNCFVPDEIVELTGITRAELDNAPTFNRVKKDLLNLFDDSVFVAHNARFDYSFIKNEFKREELTFKAKQLCTVKLSRALYPNFPHHNLDSIIERFKFKCQKRHRALDDAKILWEFWQAIQKSLDSDAVKKAVNFILKKPATPVNIPQKQLDDLPEGSGVYIFYGDNQLPLYVGKSINLRDRVLSHFSSDYLSSTELKISQQVKTIEIIETPGELGALFLESNLIKKMQPLYNRMLRYSRQMVVLRQEQNKDGYLKISLDSANNIDVNNLNEVLGIFRNKKSAKGFLINLAKENSLCEKLLGTDSTNQSCFGYRLGRCKGACAKKEIPAKYNLRFIESFSHTKLRPWPFNGPILVKEENENGKSEGFLINKWCYLGTIKSDSQLNKSLNSSMYKSMLEHKNVHGSNPKKNTFNTFDTSPKKDLDFDLDTYKILLRYLSIPKNLKNVKNLKQTPDILSENYFLSPNS